MARNLITGRVTTTLETENVLVYLNREYIPLEEARVSVQDRGFLLADGVYEVIRIYAGRAHEPEKHFERMRNGLTALDIDVRSLRQVETAAYRLMRENGIEGAGAIYAQVTRGAAPRSHAFPPEGTPPTVYVRVYPYTPYPETLWEDGADAITVPDNRWARCDIKSIALLPNVLANQAAHAADAFEALFVRDGVITEGSHSNVWAVRAGTLITYPSCNYILSGITRARVFELAHDLGIPAQEAPVFAHELDRVDEVFLSGTTTEIMPVVRVDGREIVDGQPGPLTSKLRDAFRASLPR